MYLVCMYGHLHIAIVRINRVRSPIMLLVVRRTGKNIISLSPFARENLVSRDGFGSLDPRQPAHLHTQAEYGAHLRNSSRFPRRCPLARDKKCPPRSTFGVNPGTPARCFLEEQRHAIPPSSSRGWRSVNL